MKRLFSAYVVVSWSAASKPAAGGDVIRIGVMKRDVRFRLAFESRTAATRAEAEKTLAAILDDFKRRGERALVGFDFPLGFPRGLAEGLKLAGDHPWMSVWTQIDRMVKDKADHTNNRFGAASEINRRLTGGPFPFWGCPPKDALTTLQPKRAREHAEGDLPELRHADAAAGTGSVWKVYYAGAVGALALLGIPAVKRLKAARGDAVKVWPFETGWKALEGEDLAGVDAVIAEIRPERFKAQPLPGEAKELAPVRAAAEHFAKLDEAGKLSEAFAPPKAAAPALVADVEREEGWILGL